jgi:hypothetical protein
MLANSSLRFFSFKKFVDYKKKSLYLQPNYNLTSNITELSHVVQERAEGPKAPSPGHRPGYNGNQ